MEEEQNSDETMVSIRKIRSWGALAIGIITFFVTLVIRNGWNVLIYPTCFAIGSGVAFFLLLRYPKGILNTVKAVGLGIWFILKKFWQGVCKLFLFVRTKIKKREGSASAAHQNIQNEKVL